MSIGVIIVHYHTVDLLCRAVASLKNELVDNDLKADILVVDNGSTTAERDIITQLPIRYIDAGCNMGYAGAINLGVSQTDADIIVLMNADVEFLPGCLATLLQALATNADVVGPKLYLDPQKVVMLPPTERYNRFDDLIRQLAKYGEKWAEFARGRWRHHARKHWQANASISTVNLSGALLVLQRRVWDTVGPFDEGFKLYFEEVDWLRRLQQKGLTGYYVPDAEAIHYYNQSAVYQPDVSRWFAESAQRFGRRYYGAWFLAATYHMFRHRAARLSKVPQLPAGIPLIELSGLTDTAQKPLWIELAGSPLGFPAGAARIAPEQLSWRLPAAVWEKLAPGTYHLQVVDSCGHELKRVSFERPIVVLEQNQLGDEVAHD
ncbi:MAG: glycosyltransferase family 2 protein [Anaerolineae bacterium]|nr:glycosyltransferase family 2 protein [Anaerolineae bacterium]